MINSQAIARIQCNANTLNAEVTIRNRHSAASYLDHEAQNSQRKDNVSIKTQDYLLATRDSLPDKYIK